MRYLVIGYTAKNGNKEFTSVKGYELGDDSSLPSFDDIRKDSLEWANAQGDNFNYFSINFMSYLEESDYKGLLGLK